ncbi:MAG: hypothetical protein SVC26_06715, partial [Pseudomonadota bacterium]|nr:hypothetical protein [Pseudomonadota bacterium]
MLMVMAMSISACQQGKSLAPNEYLQINPDGSTQIVALEDQGDKQPQTPPLADNGSLQTQAGEAHTRPVAANQLQALDCNAFYTLSKQDQKLCVESFVDSQDRLEQIDDEYQQRRFLSITDSEGLNQNYTPDELGFETPEQRAARLDATATERRAQLNRFSPSIIAISGRATIAIQPSAYGENWSERSQVFDWDEQYSSRLEAFDNMPYGVVDLAQPEEKLSSLLLSSIIRDEFVVPRVFLMNDYTEVIAELLLPDPVVETPSMFNYGKLQWQILMSELPAQARFILLLPDNRTGNFETLLTTNKLADRRSSEGRLVIQYQ